MLRLYLRLPLFLILFQMPAGVYGMKTTIEFSPNFLQQFGFYGYQSRPSVPDQQESKIEQQPLPALPSDQKNEERFTSLHDSFEESCQPDVTTNEPAKETVESATVVENEQGALGNQGISGAYTLEGAEAAYSSLPKGTFLADLHEKQLTYNCAGMSLEDREGFKEMYGEDALNKLCPGYEEVVVKAPVFEPAPETHKNIVSQSNKIMAAALPRETAQVKPNYTRYYLVGGIATLLAAGLLSVKFTTTGATYYTQYVKPYYVALKQKVQAMQHAAVHYITKKIYAEK